MSASALRFHRRALARVRALYDRGRRPPRGAVLERCPGVDRRGFDRLVSTGPAEVQVGILKRLKGTPIIRHDAAYAVVWSHGTPWFIDWNNHLVRTVEADGKVKTRVGWVDPVFPGDGAPSAANSMSIDQ